ncbi:MAG: cupin domain-containing protein [Geitlerinemataceae cyanobacterium]
MSALNQLLAPYNVDDFLQNFWTQKSLFISGQGDRRFDRFFSWEKLNNLLNYHELDTAMRLAVDGKVLDPKENPDFLQHCQQGATLIIDRVHKLIPELASFVSQLRSQIGHPIQINLYCSWPGKQGFRCHYDTHDVFILQIDGSKEWNVFTDTLKYPLKTDKSSQLQPPAESPYLNCVLEPGDVLYIPRGHWHYALALDRPSLHLTLGIHGKTGIDVLEWIVEEFKKKEQWRQTLPLLSPQSPVSGDRHIETLARDLTEYLSTEEVGDRYIRHLQTAYKPIGGIALPQQAGFDIFIQGVNTRFTQSIERSIEICELETGLGYQVTVGHQEILLRGVSKSFIEKLLGTANFTGTDVINWLPDYDWEIDIVPLLARLVKENILFVDRQL